MIERSIIEGLHRAQEGSKQKLQIMALKAVFDAVKADGFEDVPLPSVTVPAEKPVAKTPEAPAVIKHFSKEALNFLAKKKELVYALDGQSLKAQRLAGRRFWHIVDVGETFMTLPSIRSEVAFDPRPDKFFLPKSNNLTLVQQQEMIDEYSYKLQREFGSNTIKAIMGDAPDYSLLAFKHLDATTAKGGAEYLFGVKYDYDYARTKTPTNGSTVAGVGYFSAGHGLHVDRWSADVGDGHVHAAPLVVPV